MDKHLKNKRIKKNKNEIEPQEIFLDTVAKKKEDDFGISEKRFEVPLSKKVFWSLITVFFILISILWGEAFYFQVIQGKTFSDLSKKNKFVIHSIEAERGVIYDKNMKQLVFNKPIFDLVCQKEELPKKEKQKNKIIMEVSQIAQKNYDDLRKKIDDSDFSSIPILKDINHEMLVFLETKIIAGKLPGFQIKNNAVREYGQDTFFSHLIGYERKTGEKIGLESYYDETLKTKLGEIKIKRDASGNIISKKVISLPESGKSLVLNIDSGLEKKISEEMKKSLARVGSKVGAAVAIDPRTGGILALVSEPGFDNNLFSQKMSENKWEKMQNNPINPLFNRAISGKGYPTGSVIKPIVGIAALEEGIITSKTKIYCPLKICVQNRWHPEKEDCFPDWRFHGTSDIKKAIAESINTFFYIIGGGYEDFNGLGVRKIKKWFEAFGFGSKTGIDLPGEGQGVLPVIDKNWLLGNTYHLSIGQGAFTATPLEVAVAFVPIANKGRLLEPHIVKEIVDTNKNLIEKIEPKIIRENFVKKENLNIIREAMRETTLTGTAANYLKNLPVTSAAKTGTAQTGKKTKDGKDYSNSWITVFAPYENPKIVLTIMIKDVKEGNVAVKPVAREVLNWYFSQENQLNNE
ncbi:MAG: penicillin-binding transpeptidase domain-containing protein [Patescibacteria group bacterium]|nr:penicillin-binding transpeptidase domain-containing protein [Patescibacteria group bacterium]